jgi:hypothetical protein
VKPAEFIAKWRDNPLSERAGAQAHFLDLCELLGVEKPGNPDSSDDYCFERGATKTGAGRGWADVWKRGFFGWEYKAPGAKLEPALKQLMVYALALDNPPLLVVSDRQLIQIHTHFTGRPSQVHTVHIDHIGLPENLEKLRWLFTDPEQFKPQITRSAITIQAAKLFGDLARVLQERGHEPRVVAHFLNKILFCLFAQNTKSPHGDLLEKSWGNSRSDNLLIKAFLSCIVARNYFAHHRYLDHTLLQSEKSAFMLGGILVTVLLLLPASHERT